MLKQILIFCFLFGMTHFAQAQHLQLVENRGEIGLFGGQSSYRGDIAPDLLKFKNNFGAYYKKQFNDYGGFRLNYEQIQIGTKDTLSENIYAKNRGFFFSRNFHDISLMGEFYFTRFLPGNKTYRFTPYLGIGVGYLLEAKTSNIGIDSLSTLLRPLKIDSVAFPSLGAKKGIIHFPIQIGFKFNLSRRWNVFGEAMYRFTLSDELDFFPDGQMLEQRQKNEAASQFMIGGSFDEERIGAASFINRYQGSRSGKDQFFSVKAGVSYNLIKIYGPSKGKPGSKRSKLSSLKDKQSNQNKPGFFSRLKFKRK
jgi:opacity protein-like surface antigen